MENSQNILSRLDKIEKVIIEMQKQMIDTDNIITEEGYL